ncbi:rho gtpase-activating protein 68f [Anaeramoeba flamelloides]|uniref:Rho gtpase-activating protein 68f n=1 Tax=Anaeramoeba flamelloides TaxID=1746091 RepID=A0AAV8A703_9EUKA|nr:rho gtpase-activating protein 68f [Anaeramoeba flamelloides]KAJ6253612.1 rho gtpase-activating protein 68f [Anaeramoeba flamelloides]
MSKFSVFKKKSNQYSQRKVFGAQLSSLLPIQPFIQRCLDFIRAKGLNKKGIFRVSPSPVVVQKIIKEVNKGIAVDITRYDPFTAATLIKTYLRDMPEPIIPVPFFKSCLEILESKEEIQLEMLISLLQELPVVNKSLFLQIFDLLSEVIKNSTINKMGADNLAIFFGPAILHPNLDELKPLEAVKLNDKTIKFGTLILNNYHDISVSIDFDEKIGLPFYQSIEYIQENFTYKKENLDGEFKDHLQERKTRMKKIGNNFDMEDLEMVLNSLYQELYFYRSQHQSFEKELRVIIDDLKDETQNMDSNYTKSDKDLKTTIQSSKELYEKYNNLLEQIQEQEKTIKRQRQISQKQEKKKQLIEKEIILIENEFEKEGNQSENFVHQIKNEVSRLETEKINLKEDTKSLEIEKDQLETKYLTIINKIKKIQKNSEFFKKQLDQTTESLENTQSISFLLDKKISIIKLKFLDLIKILKLERDNLNNNYLDNVKKINGIQDHIFQQKIKYQQTILGKNRVQDLFLVSQSNIKELQKKLVSENNEYQNQENEINFLLNYLQKLKNEK